MIAHRDDRHVRSRILGPLRPDRLPGIYAARDYLETARRPRPALDALVTLGLIALAGAVVVALTLVLAGAVEALR